MTVEEARSKRVCRICEKPCSSPGPQGWQFEFYECIAPEKITMNYGEEYAHTECLEKANESDSVRQQNL